MRFFICRSIIDLLMMIAQDQIEALSSPSITSLTMKWAWRNSEISERSVCASAVGMSDPSGRRMVISAPSLVYPAAMAPFCDQTEASRRGPA
jgi:hypothetical protein